MSRKLIALTFDDGPHPETTVPILDILEEYRVPASFFAVGQHITEETAPILRRAVSLGCEIHNHSFSHRALTDCTAQEIAYEIGETARRIEQTVGQPPRFFRPPYIAVNDAMFRHIPMPFIAGYGVRDYDDSVSAETRFSAVMRQAADGRIILLHDAEGNFRTVEAMRRIVPALLEAGFTPVTVSALFAETGIVPQERIIYYYANQQTMYAEDDMIQITPADPDDRDVQALFAAHDDAMLAFLGKDSGCYTRYGAHEQLGRVWVAYCSRIPAGCIAYREKEAGIGEVKRLFVSPASRRMGIAKRLYHALEAYASSLGCRKLVLDTRITLEPAVTLYRSLGFAVTQQAGLYVQMEKPL